MTTGTTPDHFAAVRQHFDVVGMTCSHCEHAIESEVAP